MEDITGRREIGGYIYVRKGWSKVGLHVPEVKKAAAIVVRMTMKRIVLLALTLKEGLRNLI